METSQAFGDKVVLASVVLEPFYAVLERATTQAPTPVFVRAIRTTLRLWEAATANGLPWREPFVCINDAGQVVLEWWQGKNKHLMCNFELQSLFPDAVLCTNQRIEIEWFASAL